MMCDSATGLARAVFYSCRGSRRAGEERVGGIALIKGQPGSTDYRGIQIYHV